VEPVFLAPGVIRRTYYCGHINAIAPERRHDKITASKVFWIRVAVKFSFCG
jgi:hypothetical protein